MTITKSGSRRGMCAVVIATLAFSLMPIAAWAAGPVAIAEMYEVAEALTFKGAKTAGDAEDFAKRMARATLLGKKVTPIGVTSPFAGAQFIIANASSAVDLRTMVGPVTGRFELLVDTDPTRNSLDTLVSTARYGITGTLDLTTALQGYAGISGRWHTRKAAGTFEGLFLIPFPLVKDHPEYGYAYINPPLPVLGGVCNANDVLPVAVTGAPVDLCKVRPDEFELGIPLTKAVVVFSD